MKLWLWKLVFWVQDKIKIKEQDYRNSSVEMADVMRSNGKIYVVVAVILTLFLGLVVYLIRLDQKVSKLEKNK
jgi:uncharacterized protein HemX